jgi:DNA-binding CsgD family transcriptional regulator
VLPLLLARQAEVDCWLGRWLEASILAHRGCQLALATGQRALRTYHRYGAAMAKVHLGDADGARREALRGEEVAVRAGFKPLAALNRRVLGHLELSLGRPTAALRYFLPLAGAEWEVAVEPGLVRLLPDVIEACVAQREIADAARLTGKLEALGRQIGARWPLAAAARCHAALHSAEGRHAEAQRWCWRAIEEDRRLDRGLELGRDLLVQGIVLRRHGNRSGARTALEHAHSVFTRLGSAPWQERASVELGRAGGPRTAPSQLDPRERLVAELVAQGLNTPDVARRLGLDVIHVQRHLQSAYRKLGVRSRSSLAHRIALPPP